MSKPKKEEVPDAIELLDLAHRESYDSRGVTIETSYNRPLKHIKTNQRTEREMLSAVCEFLRDKATEAFLSGEDERAFGMRTASEVLDGMSIDTRPSAEISFELVQALSSIYGVSKDKEAQP